jgi:hypothetical protein
MVGQSLEELGRGVDWVKIMVYAHTMGPAGMPFELIGLANWLVQTAGLDERQAMACLERSSGLALPASFKDLKNCGLDASTLREEIRRGVAITPAPVLAGIELVDIPEVTSLYPGQIKTDLQAFSQAGAAGLALSWDLWWMPGKYLNLVAETAVNGL